MADPINDWLDKLEAWLCAWYKLWGGDCANLGNNATEWIQTIKDEFDENGVPSTEDCAMLTGVEDHLAETENSLTIADQSKLETLIADHRAPTPDGWGCSSS